MRQISEFPRVELGVLPTPLYKLEYLSRETGKNIYIKRDDMIGVALGGNKVRKLEFLLADAKESRTVPLSNTPVHFVRSCGSYFMRNPLNCISILLLDSRKYSIK